MGSLAWKEKTEGRPHLNLEAFQHLEVRKGKNQHRKLRRSSQGMSKMKTVRKEPHGSQERGEFPRSSLSHAAELEQDEGRGGS